jgi:hypothetical protein
MKPTPKELTHLLPLISAFGCPSLSLASPPEAGFIREQAGPISKQFQKSVAGNIPPLDDNDPTLH